jgi:hypothetical protein
MIRMMLMHNMEWERRRQYLLLRRNCKKGCTKNGIPCPASLPNLQNIKGVNNNDREQVEK